MTDKPEKGEGFYKFPVKMPRERVLTSSAVANVLKSDRRKEIVERAQSNVGRGPDFDGARIAWAGTIDGEAATMWANIPAPEGWTEPELVEQLREFAGSIARQAYNVGWRDAVEGVPVSFRLPGGMPVEFKKVEDDD